MTLIVVLSICAPIRLSLNFMLYLKLCFISSLRHFFSFANSLMSFWLQMFSIILPKTLLLMSLRKSFSNSLLACFLSLVLRSLQGWSHARCLTWSPTVLSRASVHVSLLDWKLECAPHTFPCCLDLTPAYRTCLPSSFLPWKPFLGSKPIHVGF